MQVVNKNHAKAPQCFTHIHSKDTCYLINTLDWFPLHPLLFWYIVQDFISLFLQWSKGILASSGTTHLSVPIESKITGGHLYSTGNLRVYVSSQWSLTSLKQRNWYYYRYLCYTYAVIPVFWSSILIKCSLLKKLCKKVFIYHIVICSCVLKKTLLQASVVPVSTLLLCPSTYGLPHQFWLFAPFCFAEVQARHLTQTLQTTIRSTIK